MARLFTAASSMSLSRTSAVVTAAPLTLACWVRPTTLVFGGLIGVENSLNSQYFSLGSNNSGQVQATARDGGGSATAGATANMTTGTWHHACAVFTSTTSRDAYLNGGNSANNATSKSPASMANTYIATLGGGNFANVRIADAAIWSAALTADEVLALSRGVSPLRIRRGSLVAYWPLYGFQSPEQDLVGANNLTLNNSPTQADHARVGTYSRLFMAAGNPSTATAAPPATNTSQMLFVGAGAGA